MKNLCIIPARGGSKRIPRKNIKPFLDKPIIYYSIEAAKSSKLFEEIMVSTDDIEIAEISKSFGAKIPFLRSLETSSDYATTIDVLLEVIERYKLIGREFDNICCIYPCAPFISKEILISSYQKFNAEKKNSLIPVVKYSTPIFRCLVFNGQNIEFKFPDFVQKRSQDLEANYYDAGQFYWLKTASAIINKSIFTTDSIGFEIQESESQDIDNESDWEMAELKYQLYKKGAK